jgi:gas vesicle protein
MTMPLSLWYDEENSKGADHMKKSTKVLLGIGTVTIVGFGVGMAISGQLTEKIRYKKNRTAVKRFVNEKFDGNQKLLQLVDHLSDEDLTSLMTLFDRVKNSKDKISVYGENLKDTTQDLKNKFMSLVEEWL